MSAEVFNNAIELECPKEDLRKYIGPGYRSFSYMTDFEKKPVQDAVSTDLLK